MAHGIHGIYGKGDGRWEEKENDYENEERSRAAEWPTEYTERGTRGRNRGGCPRNRRGLRRLFEERAWCNSPQSRRSRIAMAPGPNKARRQGRARFGTAAS